MHHESYKPRYSTAVAALLASTVIPAPRKSRRSKRDAYSLPMTPPAKGACIDPIEGEDDGSSLSEYQMPVSPLELLLRPPDDEIYESTAMSRSTSDGVLSTRSTSTESVPSLDTDSESDSSSTFGSPPTSPRRRSGGDLRTRIKTRTPRTCVDHPLLEKSPEPVVFLPEDSLKRGALRLNLVSNLTASLRVLKSAARSFSILTASAAVIQQPDYLTRSILSISPQYTDEKRPTLSEDEATPALRRYLNPWTASYDDAPCTGAVQMQTYKISGRLKSGRSGARCTPRPEEEVAVVEPTVQRGVRENPDFLRVIVLEMNMRREGKLSDTAQGKARYMLPPRQSCKLRVIGDPGRWACSFA